MIKRESLGKSHRSAEIAGGVVKQRLSAVRTPSQAKAPAGEGEGFENPGLRREKRRITRYMPVER